MVFHGNISSSPKAITKTVQTTTTCLTIFPTGIAHKHDGGAIMLETYSNATINNCSFTRNKATEDGGAIYVRRRSQITIINSNFQFNEVMNSGGSILVQHSFAMIRFSTFETELSSTKYGGSIAAEHVGNITISSCIFSNCSAGFGGSVSIRAESIINATNSLFNSSYSNFSGGTFY